jgi:hypothetical protein
MEWNPLLSGPLIATREALSSVPRDAPTYVIAFVPFRVPDAAFLRRRFDPGGTVAKHNADFFVHAAAKTQLSNKGISEFAKEDAPYVEVERSVVPHGAVCSEAGATRQNLPGHRSRKNITRAYFAQGRDIQAYKEIIYALLQVAAR